MHSVFSSQIIFYQQRVGRIFVTKFYHDRASAHYLKHSTYLGEVKSENSNGELKHPGICRKYYAYKKKIYIFFNICNFNKRYWLTVSIYIFQVYRSFDKRISISATKLVKCNETFFPTMCKINKHSDRNRRNMHRTNTIFIFSRTRSIWGKHWKIDSSVTSSFNKSR